MKNTIAFYTQQQNLRIRLYLKSRNDLIFEPKYFMKRARISPLTICYIYCSIYPHFARAISSAANSRIGSMRVDDKRSFGDRARIGALSFLLVEGTLFHPLVANISQRKGARTVSQWRGTVARGHFTKRSIEGGGRPTSMKYERDAPAGSYRRREQCTMFVQCSRRRDSSGSSGTCRVCTYGHSLFEGSAELRRVQVGTTIQWCLSGWENRLLRKLGDRIFHARTIVDRKT